MAESPEHDQLEPRPTYNRESVEAVLGFPIAPPFEAHVVDRQESIRFGDENAALNDQWNKLGLTTDQLLEVAREFSCNRAHQLLGSVSVREHDILSRLIGPEDVEIGELASSVLRGLSAQERDAFLQGQTGSSTYEQTKSRLEEAIQHGLMIHDFSMQPNDIWRYVPTEYSPDDTEIVAVDVAHIRFADNRAFETIEPIHFGELKEAAAQGEAAIAEYAQTQALAAYAREMETKGDTELSATQLRYWMVNLGEHNRRLAVLAELDDLELRSAVLNGTRLDEILPTDDGTYQSW